MYDEGVGMTQREVDYVPGLYKIFDEILVNAADNKQRDPKMDTIKVVIDAENNSVSVMNNGTSVPVEMHAKEKVYVPELICLPRPGLLSGLSVFRIKPILYGDFLWACSR